MNAALCPAVIVALALASIAPDPPLTAPPAAPEDPPAPRGPAGPTGDVDPTPPPPGAIVLFDGTDVEQWRAAATADAPAKWRVGDGALEVVRGAGDIVSKRTFGDAHIHVEWRTPPGGRGQLAGNSGIKVQERYEVQVLSEPLRGDAPMINGAGAIYALEAPRVNATRGPGHWQSFDIEFTAPRWEDERKIADARMTVRWNGVLVHDDVAMPKGTGGAPKAERPGRFGVLLQDHATAAEEPVRYRNIWVVDELTP